ncbi:TPA: aldo/keto reductase [Streptococcus suis]
MMKNIVFGTGGLRGGEGERIIKEAVEVGFNVFDTATAYENESTVGKALKSQRENIKIITKIKGADQGYDTTLKAVEKSLRLLRTDFIDYFLIHWPLPHRNLYLQTFEALLEMKNKGYIREVGVSNFNITHLQEIFNKFEVYPKINQIELHPYFQQTEIRNFHEKHRIETFAWSPLNKKQREILEDQTICKIANDNKISPAQAILSFEHELNVVPVVKSKNRAHMLENYKTLDISLRDEDIVAMRSLDKGWRRGGNPETHDE